MEVVGSREDRDIREERERPRKRERFLSTRTRSWGAREEGKKDTGRQRRRRCEVDSRRGVERKRGERENERMRELRVFRQLGKPSRDRSREDFFLGNMLSSFLALHTLPFSFSFAPVSLPHRSTSLHRGTKSFANRLRCGISRSSECRVQL